MRLCLSCGAGFQGAESCPQCGASPQQVEGFPAFAPEHATGDGGFREEFFSELAALEAKNFWFRARNRLIVWALDRCFARARNLLEIGCGTGFVLAGIHGACPAIRLSASEIHSAGLAFAARRVPSAELFQMDARRIPFAGEFDVIGAFDVLEHIGEDELVLKQMHQAVKPGGGILVTVPQHMFLWSHQDERACHVRRYSAEELKAKVRRAGFKVELVTSFVSLLLPLMFAARYAKRKPGTDYDTMAELRIGGLANRILEGAMNLERRLITAGFSLPAGGSLLLAARKAS